MKIHFSNVDFSSRSGPNTFGHRLADFFVRNGHQIVYANDQYDIFLAFIEPASMPKPGSKTVQRLDGIWFKPEQYHTMNKGMMSFYKNTDHVIFQSNFDKTMIEKWWGQKKNSTIIRNGIEINPRDPVKELRQNFQKVFVCSSNWRPHKRLDENINFFNRMKHVYPNSVLYILGQNPDLNLFRGRQDIKYLGSLTHEDSLRVYASSDWMLHLAWLDHCPNVVVEALSQGCKVICSSDGGTKELIEGKDRGIIIEENKYNFELIDYSKTPKVDFTGINSLPVTNKNFDKSDIDIQSVGNQYLEVFKKLLIK